ncbi:MAG: hypothetical protein BMS9Abin17_0631 [Acidimicrobiia bacterium]|nr:MAG: hypothetical protein BMS9Abin17_0631 [Acidimicrobiia bacterium]
MRVRVHKWPGPVCHSEEAAIVVAGEVKGISLFFASMTGSIVNFFKRLFARK